MSQWSEDYLLEKIITHSWHSYILQVEITSLDYRYDLEFIKNKTKWGSQVQGSFRKLSEHDYNVIANEIRKRIENE